MAVELHIDAEISSWWGVSARAVNTFLRANSSAKEINVRINSVGGDAFEGVAIYNALRKHGARIVVDVEGLAASAASVIAMAGDEIRVCKGAMIMIHEAQAFTAGTAAEHESRAVLLRKINESAADIYAARTGQDRTELLKLMDETTWMDSSDCKRLGFCDAVVEAKEKPVKPKQSARAAEMLASFKHTPASALQMYAPSALLEFTGTPAQDDQRGAQRADEESTMNEQEILKALGLTSVAEGVQKLALLGRIEAKVGKSGDEAQGLIFAALTSHGEVPELRAKVAKLEGDSETHALDALITKAKDEKKCTPAMAETVRASFKAKEITLKGAESWLANSPVIAALAATAENPAPAAEAGKPDGQQTWNGKTFAELKPLQRASLKKENPELYEAMRASSN